MKKILIIDDDSLYTEGIEKSLSDYFEITSVGSANAVKETLQSQTFDVAVLDMQLNDGSDGLHMVRILRAANIKILIVSNTATKPQLRVCLLMGVNGYLHKSCKHVDVRQAIETVLDDRNAFKNDFFDTDPIILQSKPLFLTDRQWSLLIYFICDPLVGYKAIADEMNVSVDWVKSSMSNLFGLFDVANKHQLLLELDKRGMRAKITPLMAKSTLQDHVQLIE